MHVDEPVIDADHEGMRPLCALLLSLTACGVSFQSSSGDGGSDAEGGAPTGMAPGGGPSKGGDGGTDPSSGGGGVMATGGGGAGAAGGMGVGGAGGAPVTCVQGLEVNAVVADCVLHSSPNPDACEAFASEGPTGVGEMDIDESANSTPGNVVRGYLRFDLPIEAKDAVGFTLQLVNTGITNADSPGSGEIYVVNAFTRPELFSGPPARVDTAPVAGDQGSVGLGATVSWPLPQNIVQSGSVHLEVAGTDPNGVRYWNNNGDAPPKLIVDCGEAN